MHVCTKLNVVCKHAVSRCYLRSRMSCGYVAQRQHAEPVFGSIAIFHRSTGLMSVGRIRFPFVFGHVAVLNRQKRQSLVVCLRSGTIGWLVPGLGRISLTKINNKRITSIVVLHEPSARHFAYYIIGIMLVIKAIFTSGQDRRLPMAYVIMEALDFYVEYYFYTWQSFEIVIMNLLCIIREGRKGSTTYRRGNMDMLILTSIGHIYYFVSGLEIPKSGLSVGRNGIQWRTRVYITKQCNCTDNWMGRWIGGSSVILSVLKFHEL